MNEDKESAVVEKNISDSVLARLNQFEKQGSINLPSTYSAPNALKSAYLLLKETTDKQGKCVLETCTKESIANTLLDMCIQGLSPVKKQCYFIPYGNQLKLSKSYLGNIAATKRLKGVKDVFAEIIYENDVFEYEIDLETGLKKITKHEQNFMNIDITKIKGVYAVIIREDKANYVEVMNINQIKSSWNQGSMKGQSGAHKNFTDQMCKKTVINRACKNFLDTSDDSDILVEAINNSEQIELEEGKDNNSIMNVEYEIKENANTEVIDILEETENEKTNVKTEEPEF